MTEPVYMIVDAYLKADTTVRRGLELHSQNQWVAWVRVGAFPNQFGLYFATLDDIDRFTKVLTDARQALAEAQGWLPNGEPCRYADQYGSPLWDEHDHDRCLDSAPENAPGEVPVQPSLPDGREAG